MYINTASRFSFKNRAQCDVHLKAREFDFVSLSTNRSMYPMRRGRLSQRPKAPPPRRVRAQDSLELTPRVNASGLVVLDIIQLGQRRDLDRHLGY
jgi:hypothetical protein